MACSTHLILVRFSAAKILYRQVPQKNQAWLDAILNSVDWPGVRIHCRSTLQDGLKGLWTVMHLRNKSGEEGEFFL